MSDAGKEGGYPPSCPALSAPFLGSPPPRHSHPPRRLLASPGIIYPPQREGSRANTSALAPIMKTPLMCDSQETTPPVRAAAAAKSLQSCPTLCDPQTAAHPAPPSLGFSRQEHWSGVPLPSPPRLQKGWQTADEQGGYKQSCSSPRLVLLLETRRRIFLAWHTHSPC